MGQTEHRAYVKLKNAEDKVKRNPYFSSYKEDVKDAQIEYLKALREEDEEKRMNESPYWGGE